MPIRLPRCVLTVVLCFTATCASCLSILEPPDPALQQLIEARAARLEAASRALIHQHAQFAALKLDDSDRLPASVYHYAHGNEQWGFSMALLLQGADEESGFAQEALTLARKWWSSPLRALTFEQDDLDLDEADLAALLLQLLDDPDFGRRSALARQWFRPFYAELASQPFPMPAPGQVLPPDGNAMALAHLAEIAVDFERMIALNAADDVCDFDAPAARPSATCARIQQQLQRLNRGRPLFDSQQVERNMLVAELVENSCENYAEHARMMLILLAALDRAPLSESESELVLLQMQEVCPRPGD